MALSKIEIENYRPFVAHRGIELRPITLLFGHNSAGKSALVRLLPLLLQEALLGETGPFDPLAAAGRGATFSKLRTQFNDQDLFVRLIWSRDGGANQNSFGLQIKEVAKSGELTPTLQVPAAIELDVFGHSSFRLNFIGFQEDSLAFEIQSPQKTNLGSARLRFEGIAPTIDFINWSVGAAPGATVEKFEESISAVAIEINSLKNGITWLEATRSTPARSLPFRKTHKINSDGSGAIELLATALSERPALVAEVVAWFKEATGQRLNLGFSTDRKTRYCYATLSPGGNAGIEVDIQDAGEGITQVLPVVAAVFDSAEGVPLSNPILCLEHPELHLHGNLHAHLARLLTQGLRKSRTNRISPIYLIETHSESLLLEVQLAIVRGELDKKDVVIHWVHQSPEGQSNVDTIVFDDLARPTGDEWPPDAFSESLNQAKALATLRREKTRV